MASHKLKVQVQVIRGLTQTAMTALCLNKVRFLMIVVNQKTKCRSGRQRTRAVTDDPGCELCMRAALPCSTRHSGRVHHRPPSWWTSSNFEIGRRLGPVSGTGRIPVIWMHQSAALLFPGFTKSGFEWLGMICAWPSLAFGHF